MRGFTLHTKLVLTTTVILLFGGALLILALDWNNASSLGSLKPAQKAMAAFFQSVTTRTAGFETIPQANFSDGSAMVSMILMFIGGSPMGTAGGVKTTTVAILLVVVASYIRGDSDTVVWGRKVMEENIRTAVVIFFFALTMAFTATVLLISVTGSPLLDCCMRSFPLWQPWTDAVAYADTSGGGKNHRNSGHVHGTSWTGYAGYCTAAEKRKKRCGYPAPGNSGC